MQNYIFVYKSKKAFKIFLKKKRREETLKRRRIGFLKHMGVVKKYKEEFNPNRVKNKYLGCKNVTFKKKPEHSDLIQFLIPKYKKFSEINLPINDDGKLIVPTVFSISENTDESMLFLKRLFHCLYTQKNKIIYIDYINCKYLDVDASACMDLILEGFIKYYNKCIHKRHKVNIQKILPINFENDPNLYNVLFSIGAYKNIKGFELKKSPDANFLAFNLRTGDSQHDKKGVLKELHETEIVDYVIDCLRCSGHELTASSESNLSKVVGEVMANAEEHSNFRYRYAIGYFVKPQEINNDLGEFKLSIFNFGQTIYESFSKEEKKDLEVVKTMRDLSSKYTQDGLFRKAKFEEETLWTLYSLQEGVTSLKNWKRGKGTIRFIDRFFKLKGNDYGDNNSKLTLISGNSKIVFDGTYPLKEVLKGSDVKPIQVMTFNDSGEISELPNEKFVTFVPQTFPGTLITAKICITSKNTI